MPHATPHATVDSRHAPFAGVAVTLGLALRARRKALSISMAAAADAAGISRVTWHRLEKGEATVALGSLLAAARVLGVNLHLQTADVASPTVESVRDDALPLHLRLDEYPQFRRLAWQVGDAIQTVSPREALGLYERNWRHLQSGSLEPKERALIDALRQVFGAEELHV